MSKSLKLVGKILLGILVTLLTGLLILVIVISVGSSQGRKAYKNENNIRFNNWMSYVDDDIFVKDVVIPGSHDAGSYSMSYLGETQSKSIEEQLNDGVRYFDLRVNDKDGELVIFHSIIDGVKYTEVLDDLITFIDSNPSEFVILDFQHFKNNSFDKVMTLIEDRTDKFVINNDRDNTNDLDFISNLKVKDARGKFIVTAGVDYNKVADRDFIFVRSKDESQRENSILESYYYSDLHKKSSKKFISSALNSYIERFKEKDQGLFVLQCQLTDGLFIFGPAYRENAHTNNIENYIDNLNKSDNLKYINIIMRDFLDIKKSSQIIGLNLDKSNIKQGKLSDFQALLKSI